METLNLQLADLQTHWAPIAPILSIRNEAEYDAAVVRLNSLLEVVGTNQSHPLYSLVDTLGTLVHNYELEHHAIPDTTGAEVVAYLMEEHGLTSEDLPEIGPSDMVEQYLNGEIELSVEQIRALANRFRTSAAAFI
jgi:HTH-type transcriptional regulator/antitoxin HigA